MIRLWLRAALAAALTFSLGAQVPGTKRVEVTARLVPEQAAPGAVVKLQVTAEIEPGYHVYGALETTGAPVSIALDETGGLTPAGAAQVPPGVRHEIAGFESFWIEGRAELTQELAVPARAAGTITVSGRLLYMACTPDYCDPPDEAPFTATLTVAGGAAGAGAELGPFGGPAEGKRVELRTRFEPARAAPGERVVLRVTAAIDPGYHIYGSAQLDGQAAVLTVADHAALRARGTPNVPAGTLHEAFGQQTFWIEHEAVIEQEFVVATGAAPGSVELGGLLSYTACTPDYCDPADEVAWTARFEVVAAREDSPASGGAQDPVPGLPGFGPAGEPKVAVAARFEPARARPGQTVTLVVEATVDPGWHVYGSDDTSGSPIAGATLTEPAGLEPAGALQVPPGTRHEIAPGFVNHWLVGTFEMRQAWRVPLGAAAGALQVHGEAGYMPCDENLCLKEESVAFTAALEIAGEPLTAGELAAAAGGGEGEGGGQVEGDAALGSGWLALILAAIGAGLLALVMPCTYPMIPITFSFFTKQADARGGNVLPLALVYGGGIIAIFVLIGLAVGPIVVPFATHWLTNLVIGVAFIVFALALFGAIYLQPPQWLMAASDKAAGYGGYFGVFLMGATLVVTSFTCTVPFVGSMLSVAAVGGLDRVVVGMAVFGLTMAIPFVALALLPGKVKTLPRSGQWMNTVKVTLGFVELAAALKFISNVDLQLNPSHALWLPRELFLLLWSAIFVVAGLYLLGMFRLKDDAPDGIGPGRMVTGLGSMLLAFYFVFGALGFRMDNIVMSGLLPQYSAPFVQGLSGRGGSGEDAELRTHTVIEDDFESAVALAKETEKLVLINVTGVL